MEGMWTDTEIGAGWEDRDGKRIAGCEMSWHGLGVTGKGSVAMGPCLAMTGALPETELGS